MEPFNASTYKDQKGDFNSKDEDRLLSLLTTQHPRRVLDVGCGDGTLTHRVKNALPQSEIVAIDNSESQIGLAVRTASDGITFMCTDVIDYSVPEPFDAIYSFYAFPHIPKSDVPSALRSVARLLKPEGELYLFTNIALFDTSKVPHEDQEACDIVFLNDWPSQINLISLPEMQKMIADEGLDEVENRPLETGAKVKEYGDMISYLFVLRRKK